MTDVRVVVVVSDAVLVTTGGVWRSQTQCRWKIVGTEGLNLPRSL